MSTMFEIFGEQFDMEGLARLFDKGSPSVKKISDRYCLLLEGLDSTSEEACSAAAESALTRMNALAFVRYANHHPVRIKGPARVDPDTGQVLTKVSLGGNIVGRSRLYSALCVNGEIAEDCTAQTAFRLADSNEPLERALYLYGTLPHDDWRALYMIYEAFRDGDGNTALLKAASKQIDAFTGTTQSYKALGKDARHGSPNAGGYPEPKITLVDAMELIRKLLEGWIERLSRKSP
jgi:hypothetical protein